MVIEEDIEDQEILDEVFKFLNYPNPVMYFTDGYEALDFIERTDLKPFLILSDINMPKIDGFELRKKIYNNEQLNIRCIPYLFFTTGAQQMAAYDAYSLSPQGFFIKPNNMKDLENTMRKIVEYWQVCFSPSQNADLRTPVERNAEINQGPT